MWSIEVYCIIYSGGGDSSNILQYADSSTNLVYIRTTRLLTTTKTNKDQQLHSI